jgi:hypothetical protein
VKSFLGTLKQCCQVWWQVPVIPAFRRLRQKDHEFETSIGCIKNLILKSKTKSQCLHASTRS